MLLIAAFAALFAVCCLVGDNFRDHGSLFASFRTPSQIALQLLGLAVYFLAAFAGISVIAAIVRYSREQCPARTTVTKCWPIALLFLVCWLPYLIFNFPGMVPFDGMFQINEALGAHPLTNHHPAIASLFYGSTIGFARFLGIGDVNGVLLIVVLQFVFTAYVLAELVRFVDETARNRVLTIGAIAFFALYPTWGYMVQAVIKDTLYTGFFVLFVLGYAKCVLHGSPGLSVGRDQTQGPIHKDYAFLFIGALGMCFFRNNGIHIVVLCLVVLLILQRDAFVRKRVAAGFALVVLVFCGVTGPLYTAIGVQPGSAKEMLSIPLQQFARYVSHYDAEITLEERELIDKVVDYELIKSDYEPELSDNVKDTFREGVAREDIDKLVQLYFVFLGRHPGVFIEAPLHNSYKYYYFFEEVGKIPKPPFQHYTQFSINESLSYTNYLPCTAEARLRINQFALWVTSLPLLDILNRCGFYTWVLLLCVLSALIRRRPRELAVALPLILCVLVCIASPVNGYHRYMWPVMATVWIPLALVWWDAKVVPGAKREL